MSASPARSRFRKGGVLLAWSLACFALLTPACSTWDGHFCLMGYSTKPNYDMRFRTVRVPIFKNRTMWTATTVPGMEMDLTRAVIREIQTKTPYKIVQDDADTELKGTIIAFTKSMLNYTQFNTVREAQTMMIVELVWRDCRTGEILSRTARRRFESLDPDQRQPLLATPDSLLPPGTKPPNVAATPLVPTSGPAGAGEEEIVDPITRVRAVPIIVRSIAEFRPELGESITTAMQRNIDRMAVQIVSAMEKSWDLP